MKRTINLLLIASTIIVCAGCLVNRQSAHQIPHLLYSTNGVPLIGYESWVSSWNSAGGDAKQVIGTTRSSITRTGTVNAGAKDVNEDAKASDTIGSLTSLLQQLNELKSPLPPSALPPVPR